MAHNSRDQSNMVEIMRAGAWGDWSFCILTQKRKGWILLSLLAHSYFFFQSRKPLQKVVALTEKCPALYRHNKTVYRTLILSPLHLYLKIRFQCSLYLIFSYSIWLKLCECILWHSLFLYLGLQWKRWDYITKS